MVAGDPFRIQQSQAAGFDRNDFMHVENFLFNIGHVDFELDSAGIRLIQRLGDVLRQSRQ